MEIKKLTPESAEAYQRLLLRALQEFPAAFAASYAESLHQSIGQVAQNIQDLQQVGGQLFGAFSDQDELVGVVGLKPEQVSKLRHKGVIFGLYVSHGYHGRGLGKKLMEALLTYAREGSDLDQLNLVVGEGNIGAQRLYASLGFQPFGVEPRELKVDGKYYNGVHMWLKLS
ncbi:MAG: GNAT family N-acetyltransferase [bacterium]